MHGLSSHLKAKYSAKHHTLSFHAENCVICETALSIEIHDLKVLPLVFSCQKTPRTYFSLSNSKILISGSGAPYEKIMNPSFSEAQIVEKGTEIFHFEKLTGGKNVRRIRICSQKVRLFTASWSKTGLNDSELW